MNLCIRPLVPHAPDPCRVLASAFSSVLFLLSACNGQLAVVDDLNHQNIDLSGNEPNVDVPASAPAHPGSAGCACASSAGLIPLICNGEEVPLLDNDVVQATTDGSVVAFNLEDATHYEVAYWDGSETQILSNGALLALSAAGDRLLVEGAGVEGGLTVLKGRGGVTHLAIDAIMGRGTLSAAADLVIGAVYNEDGAQLARANANTGEVELLGKLGADAVRAYVTPDASTVVGFASPDSDSLEFVPFRWNQQGLTFGLAGVDPGGEVWPEAVSSDGSVIAGRSVPGKEHFRWSEAGGYQRLASASWRSETFVSADGSVVIGSLDPEGPNDSAVFRWTQETGAVDLTPGAASLAVDQSDDGRVVVANSWEDAQNDGATPQATYVWDPEHGTRTLVGLLSDGGVDTTGWEFGHARALSGNGKVLLGRGMCGGVPTLYRVLLSD